MVDNLAHKIRTEMDKLKRRITNLESWNKEMYENHKIEVAKLKHKLEEYNMPSKTPKQARAMRVAAAGKSTLGIPKKVGKEFVKADKSKKKSKK